MDRSSKAKHRFSELKLSLYGETPESASFKEGVVGQSGEAPTKPEGEELAREAEAGLEEPSLISGT